MKRTIFWACLFLFVGGLFSPAAPAQEKPRIGVLRFTNHTSAGWWSASVGEELSDMLVSELVSTKAFQVLDRKEIDAVLGEQDLGASGRIDPATKAKIGKIKGAKYLVAATVSSYERTSSRDSARRGVAVVGAQPGVAYIARDR